MSSKHFGPMDIIAMLELEAYPEPPSMTDPDTDPAYVMGRLRRERRQRYMSGKQAGYARKERQTSSEWVRKPFTSGDGNKVNPRYDLDEERGSGLVIDLTQDPWRVPPIPPHHIALATEIRDRVFRSRTFAAKALGVSRTTIQYHVRRGTLHRVGLFMRAAVPCEDGDGNKFESYAAMGRAKGVQGQTVEKAAKRGTLHNVGNRGRKPIDYNGTTFKSFKELADFLGVSPSTVSTAHKRGRLASCGKGKGTRTDLRSGG